MIDRQTIWLIDKNTSWAVEISRQIRKDGRTIKILRDANKAYEELDKVFFNSNSTKRPDIIIASSEPMTTPNLQQFMDMTELSQVPLIITDYAKNQALVRYYEGRKTISCMHDNIFSSTLPKLFDETLTRETHGRGRG